MMEGDWGGEWNVGGENESTGELAQLSFPPVDWCIFLAGGLERGLLVDFFGLEVPFPSLGAGEETGLS